MSLPSNVESVSKPAPQTATPSEKASEPRRNPDSTEECVKAHVAETTRLEDEDDACFDSIG